MIDSANKNLLKIFILCLLLHIIVLPMFSLVLPAKPKKSRYQIVYLYQEPKSPTKDVSSIRITPQLPLTHVVEKKKIDIPVREFGRFEKDISIGMQKTPILVVEKKENIELELPQPKISAVSPQISPNISESTSPPQEKITGEGFEISGPGGTRTIISKVLPDYPLWAEQKGIEANVRIKIWVNRNGFVSSTEVIETSGYRQLDIIAEQALKKWRFASINQDMDVWAIVTLKFRLK